MSLEEKLKPCNVFPSAFQSFKSEGRKWNFLFFLSCLVLSRLKLIVHLGKIHLLTVCCIMGYSEILQNHSKRSPLATIVSPSQRLCHVAQKQTLDV